MKKLNYLVAGMAVSFAMVLQGCGNDGVEGSTEAGNDSAGSDNEEYPVKDIEVVVGWGAGGGSDTFARAIANELSDILDTNINVVNNEGASGAIAGDYVRERDADGYTIWAISSNYPINVAQGNTPHGLDAYTPVGRVQDDIVTIQTKGGEFANIEDFLDRAQDEKITVGGTGSLGFDELILTQMELEADADFNFVPYESAGEMHAALLGGHIDAQIEQFSPTIGQVEAGEVDILLAFNDESVPGYEDVPYATEFGWDVIEGQNRGLVVHSDTPEYIVDILAEALEEAKEQPRYKEYEEDSYLHLREGWLPSEEWAKELENVVANYEELLEVLGQ
ncbi:tripartite tricarboxylate transporter substrate binding protein [Alteribacter populi]|uniref:tripartite tricarboxylate transporter substrate binding protein n=1 Tax=Alteribacter populi TaxID=2011011 RepID=UPI000BBB5A65|nr:tripartite tricarboxylate transporter substrate binding protein [Alteribacter populi]